MGRMRFSGTGIEQEVAKKMAGDVADAIRKIPMTQTQLEDGMAGAVDIKKQVDDFVLEWLPVFKRVRGEKNPEKILEAASPLAALTQFGTLLFGSERGKIDASDKIMNRSMGKPIERQVSLHGDIGSMKEAEVKNELRRLFRKLGPDIIRAEVVEPAGDRGQGVSDSVEGAGEDSRRSETSSIQTEQNTKTISRE